MKNKIINISNSLSFLRLVLTIPVCWFLLNNNKIWFLILVIAALLTDYLDGYFARKRNEITEFGKVMDPVADKVIIGAIAVIMLIQGLIPLWFLLAVLSRDILI
ncbi:MAG: CDP-alcohol phosphatidyltransferase family protein, partial [Ignavibacteriae bacterium]|nr:CDP-alcohol phosphatidyltransferase family protein [Ignavibacteriota bacterium]